MKTDFKDYYAILRINKNASLADIKKAYKYYAVMYHPDKHMDKSEAERSVLEEKFKLINEAYEVLKDDSKRYSYNILYNTYYDELEREKIRQEEERKKEAERKKKEAEERKRKEAERRKKAEAKKVEKSYFSKAKDNIVNSYNEVKQEERNYNLKTRHSRLNNLCHEKTEDYLNNLAEIIVIESLIGVVHVFFEAFYQVQKLKYVTEDSIPKFVIRNRNLAALGLGVVIMSNVIGGSVPQKINAEDNSSTYISEEIPEDSDLDNEVNTSLDSNITLTREYTVKAGDTLSQLEYDSGTGMTKINTINGYKYDNKNLYVGQVMEIPYKIKSEDLQYYTGIVEVGNRSLSDIALEYETTIDTLIKLNKDSIEVIEDSAYIILSDSLIVPDFITKEELITIKETVNSTNYEYSKNY
jgi:curved DNA-binding protein CbpA/LysM repeat protein